MKKKQLFAFVLLFLSVYCFAEVRSLWILPWDIKSPASIDKVIADALASNQNELLVEVRYRSDALYTPNRRSQKYPNPEPRSYVLANDGFDPLAYTLEHAHNAGLAVQAWVVVFNATPLDKKLIQQNYIYQNHQNWITNDKNGQRMNSGEQFGHFIDPGIPEAQEHILDVLCDIVDGYPELDGLHLDYIRYPSSQLGYHPTSLNRFEQYKDEGHQLTWNQWRMMQVTEFVQKCHSRVKAIRPDIMLSAAVFSNIYDATVAYAQDWYSWLDMGIIDMAYPMAYTVNYDHFGDQVDSMLTRGYQDKVVMGLRAWNAKGGSLLPLDSPSYNVIHIKKRIDLVRQNSFAGIALFSYEGLKKGDALSRLASMAYLDAAPMVSKRVAKRVDVVFTPLKDKYSIDLDIPVEGRWNWEIRQDDEVLYSRFRYYLEGENRDFWNGRTFSGQTIAPGVYNLHISRDIDKYQSIIPIFIKEMEIE